MSKDKNKWGVVIGRFQTPYLTAGHKYLIEKVLEKHERVLVIVGVHQTQPTARNPLSYESRKMMLENACPDIFLVVQVKDHLSDEIWSNNIDAVIKETVGEEAIIYGCRDSCLKYYSGNYPKEELETMLPDSATDVRAYTAKTNIDSPEFRAGQIYAISNRIPSPYMCVDVAMLVDNKGLVVGMKEGETAYRFIGGFLDSTDLSLAHAAYRELKEETSGVEAINFKIIGEMKINDWRYRNENEKVFTTLFKCNYVSGVITASDDMPYLTIIPLKNLESTRFITEHEPLKQLLINHLKSLS